MAGGIITPVHINNPTQPEPVFESDNIYDYGSICDFLTVHPTQNTTAYLSCDGDPGAAVDVVDFTDPANPQTGNLLGLTPSGSAVNKIWAYGNRLFTKGDDLYFIDISDPGNPQLEGSYTPSSGVNDLVTSPDNPDIIYFTENLDGLTILDISNPASPQVLGQHPITNPPNFAQGIRVRGDYAFLALGSGGGIEILNISNPASIQ